jgi:hypothetical protein
MPTCIDGLLDALLISLGSPLTTFPLNCRKRRKLWLKGSWSFGISGGATRGQLWWREFYPDLVTKAAALGHSLIQNHPFVDGNKRVGHGAMEVFLLLNGYEIDASTDEQEIIIIDVARGEVSRIELSAWISKHIVVRK